MSRFLAALAIAVGRAAGGCASLNDVDADVSSYSRWPSGRAPGDLRLRAAAVAAGAGRSRRRCSRTRRARAIEGAGFVAGARRRRARRHRAARRAHHRDRPLALRRSVLVRRPAASGIGRSATAATAGRSGGPGWRRGYWGRPVLRLVPATSARSRVLIRDKRSGEPLYEARARERGPTTGVGDGAAGDVRRRAEGLPGRRHDQPAPRHRLPRRAEARGRRAAALSSRRRQQGAQVGSVALRASSPPRAAAPAWSLLCKLRSPRRSCAPSGGRRSGGRCSRGERSTALRYARTCADRPRSRPALASRSAAHERQHVLLARACARHRRARRRTASCATERATSSRCAGVEVGRTASRRARPRASTSALRRRFAGSRCRMLVAVLVVASRRSASRCARSAPATASARRRRSSARAYCTSGSKRRADLAGPGAHALGRRVGRRPRPRRAPAART